MKTATITMKLNADSGYQSVKTTRISPAQWGAILAIANDKPIPAALLTAAKIEVAGQTSTSNPYTENDTSALEEEVAMLRAKLAAMPAYAELLDFFNADAALGRAKIKDSHAAKAALINFDEARDAVVAALAAAGAA